MAEATEVAKEIVVFFNPDNTPFSNDPRWGDSRVREAWQELQDQEEDAQRVTSQADGSEDEDPETVDDYSAWTNDELRAELSERKLSVEGKKADMVKRLQDDDEKAEA